MDTLLALLFLVLISMALSHKNSLKKHNEMFNFFQREQLSQDMLRFTNEQIQRNSKPRGFETQLDVKHSPANGVGLFAQKDIEVK